MLDFLRKIWIRHLGKDKTFYDHLKRLLDTKPRDLALYRRAFASWTLQFKDGPASRAALKSHERFGRSVIRLILTDYLSDFFRTLDPDLIKTLYERIMVPARLQVFMEALSLNGLIQAEALEYSDFFVSVFECFMVAVYKDLGYQRCRRFFLEIFLPYYMDIERLEDEVR